MYPSGEGRRDKTASASYLCGMTTTAPLGSDRWRDLVDEFERGGLSAKEFTGKKGLTVSALSYWRRRLAGEARTATQSALAVSFVEVHQEPAPAPAGAAFSIGLRNGRTVSVPTGFDEQALHRLLVVVEGGA